jgi:hypothetical protein
MINKRLYNNAVTSPFELIHKVLNEFDDNYLTKEEIYGRVDLDEQGCPLITISALERAIRCMVQTRQLEVVYFKGVRHFGLAKDGGRF